MTEIRPTSPPETAARGLVSSPDDAEYRTGLKRAVIYLRVSSNSQVNTDYDPEGLSIPAQREACLRKVRQMDDAEVVGEFVEPGKSGTTMDRRPAFQAMLEQIREQRDIDYVIIYKLSRMNRNRIDDALVMMQLRKYGVTLVSATEMIDATPEGQLMHGVLASFNEFRSAADGADIRYKMGEKAKRGGTLGRAPLGYLNVRETFEGRELRTVVTDPERGPLIRQAFELYATGDYTVAALCDELTHRGLRTRPGRYPAGPISDSKLGSMLRDRYYLGFVSYKGEEYPGRHEALISPELWDAVQSVLAGRKVAGERQRIHHHYLKGSIWCGACKSRGRDSRMIIQRAVGRGGTYFYFFCAAKQHLLCDEPYIPIATVEAAVEKHLHGLAIEPEFAKAVQTLLADTLADQQRSTELRSQQLQAQLTKLDRQEENLIDLAADGNIDTARIRSRLRRIRTERDQIGGKLDSASDHLEAGASLLTAVVDLLAEPGNLYGRSDDQGRRLINQAIFHRLYIHQGEIVGDQIHEAVAEVVELDRALRVVRDHEAKTSETLLEGIDSSIKALSERLRPETTRGRRAVACLRPLRGTRTLLLASALSGGGSSKDVMVELRGIEPLTSSMPWRSDGSG